MANCMGKVSIEILVLGSIKTVAPVAVRAAGAPAVGSKA